MKIVDIDNHVQTILTLMAILFWQLWQLWPLCHISQLCINYYAASDSKLLPLLLSSCDKPHSCDTGARSWDTACYGTTLLENTSPHFDGLSLKTLSENLFWYTRYRYSKFVFHENNTKQDSDCFNWAPQSMCLLSSRQAVTTYQLKGMPTHDIIIIR